MVAVRSSSHLPLSLGGAPVLGLHGAVTANRIPARCARIRRPVGRICRPRAWSYRKSCLVVEAQVAGQLRLEDGAIMERQLQHVYGMRAARWLQLGAA